MFYPPRAEDGTYRYLGSLPPFDKEFYSVIVGGHDYRANMHMPLGSFVSPSVGLLVGYNTATDKEMTAAEAGSANGQAAMILSVLHRNKTSPGVGLMIGVNPGVDGTNGCWGVNVNFSNNGHTIEGSGLFGMEVNGGLDNAAKDVPYIGLPGQSIGVTVTESSVNKTGKRMTTAWGMGSNGFQNFHHGISVASSPTAQTPMDTIIRATGPVRKCLDFSHVTSDPIAIDLPHGGGIKLGSYTETELKALPPSDGVMYWCSDRRQIAISDSKTGFKFL